MLEKIKNINKKRLLSNLLLIFIIIQPFLDFYLLFDERITNIFRFSPSTLIRMGFMFIILILYLMSYKKEGSNKLCLMYFITIIIYSVFHIWNAQDFNSYFDHNFNFSVVTEVFYIVRMILPLILIYISSKIHYKDNQLVKTITWLIILISGSIVFFNLIGFSLGTYSHDISNYSIFDWFKTGTYKEGTYYTIATKGFFMYGNQVSALLLFLNILCLRYLIVKDKPIFYVLITLNLFAMMMLGTKTATLGVFASIVFIAVLYVIFSLFKKIDFSKRVLGFLIICSLAWVGLYNIAPANNRTEEDTKTLSKRNPSKEAKSLKEFHSIFDQYDDETKKIKMIEFIDKNYEEFGITEFMLFDSYNYHNDPEFWIRIFEEPHYNRYNYRFMEKAMLARIKEVNNNKYDNYLGITYSRMSNVMPLERDFVSHYYTMGIIGAFLLLGPYVFILIKYAIYMLGNLKERVTFDNLIICMSISILLLSAYNSGNVLDSLFVSLIFAFFLGQYKRIYEKIK